MVIGSRYRWHKPQWRIHLAKKNTLFYSLVGESTSMAKRFIQQNIRRKLKIKLKSKVQVRKHILHDAIRMQLFSIR